MAEKVEKFGEGKLARQNRRYPWSKWTDGEAWLLVRGEDYDVDNSVMCSVAHVHAKRSGMTVKTYSHARGIVVQFSSPKPKVAKKAVKRAKKVRKFPRKV